MFVIGNQKRIKMFKKNIYIRRLTFTSLALPFLFYDYENDIYSGDFISNIYISLLFIVLAVLVIGYQIYKNIAYIKSPELVLFIYEKKPKNNKLEIANSITMGIVEELFFRVLLFYFIGESPSYFILVSVTTFSIYHICSPWGKEDFDNHDILNQFIFGAIFSISLLVTSWYLAPIILHILFNIGSIYYRILLEYYSKVKNEVH
nr:CPBP family intramembrane glutamic endopeptidase [Vibrio nigripulchritudo]